MTTSILETAAPVTIDATMTPASALSIHLQAKALHKTLASIAAVAFILVFVTMGLDSSLDAVLAGTSTPYIFHAVIVGELIVGMAAFIALAVTYIDAKKKAANDNIAA